jgi:sec-independent protein translocase protein TatB
MFDLSGEKLFILAIVALLVLGPERLPTAATWLARTCGKSRISPATRTDNYAARVGPELDELRPTLNDLRNDLAGLRTWRGPRTMQLHHPSDDPASFPHYPAAPSGTPQPSNPQLDRAPPRPLTIDERPPIDPDAT